MSFWHDSTGRDPKRQYRWILVNDHIPLYTLKSVSKPSFSVTQAEHRFLNHTYYYPGRVEWQTITMSLADPVGPDAAATVTNIINDSGYAPATNDQELSTMSRGAATAALGEVQIQQLDSEGNVLETWTLWNAFIVDVKYGDLDYEGDDLTAIELELRYDYAHLETTEKSSQGRTEFFKPGR